ncbi:MAG: Asp23/Gls24 family envelope stress response protein [Bacillota bacterium]|jgi:uncharacterized alkaline shock family protein YloU|nr:Asp23/Gls24 family envelope stress response protein [Candidatus Fermentithermobacillaceae bacterium]
MPDYINVSDDLQNKGSKVRISDEVIAAIAGVAASQVEGVAAMSGNIVGDISSAILGKKSKGRGVKVSLGEKEVSLDLYLNVSYGARIPEVAYSVQENVKKSIESMTDLKVTQVNIHIQGVSHDSVRAGGSDA